MACALTLWPQALSFGCPSPSLLSCPWGALGPGTTSIRRHPLKARTQGCVPGTRAPRSVPTCAELQGLWGQTQRANPSCPPPNLSVWPLVLGPGLQVLSPWPVLFWPLASAFRHRCPWLTTSLHFLVSLAFIPTGNAACIWPGSAQRDRTPSCSWLGSGVGPAFVHLVCLLSPWQPLGPSDPAPACPTLYLGSSGCPWLGLSPGLHTPAVPRGQTERVSLAFLLTLATKSLEKTFPALTAAWELR